MEPRTYSGKAPIRRRGRPWYFYILYFFLIFFLLTSAWVLFLIKTQNAPPWITPWSKPSRVKSLGGEFNVMIAGLDAVGDVRRTDSLLVAHVSIAQRSLSVVSIPRDSLVPVPGHGEDKINAAYALGGPDLTVRTVEDFLGVPIQFYFIMYVQGFVRVIDSLGGVEMNVEKDMHYDDRAQNLHIHLKRGLQLLNGEQAMGYARFRHDAQGDFARIGRQQKLLDALQRKALSFDILRGLPTILDALRKNDLLITNLNLNDAYDLRRFYTEEVRRNTRMFMLPGEPRTIHGVSYVVPDGAEIPYIVGGVFKGGYNPQNRAIRIEVKNGCGYRGVAEGYARRLAYYGFDVLGTSNADSFDYERTVVVVRKPTPFDGAVARIMNAGVVQNPDPDAIEHMDVVIGRDKLGRPVSGIPGT